MGKDDNRLLQDLLVEAVSTRPTIEVRCDFAWDYRTGLRYRKWLNERLSER